MSKWIWLDMDGTISNLYGVEGWLEDIRAECPRPYKEAAPIYDTVDLLITLSDLKSKGYKIGVISWLSKKATPKYQKEIIQAKKNWLREQYLDMLLDEIIITAYGIKKSASCASYGVGILVDDEKQNREEWNLGKTIDATKNIIEQLRELL